MYQLHTKYLLKELRKTNKAISLQYAVFIVSTVNPDAKRLLHP